MKRIHVIGILILVCVIVVSVSCFGNSSGAKYDQSTPQAAIRSFMQAMIEGDKTELKKLIHDPFIFSYMESDLLRYATKEMNQTSISDYYVYPGKETGDYAYVTYNHTKYPQPATANFFVFDVVYANKQYYISDVNLPSRYFLGYSRHIKCMEGAKANGGVPLK